MNATGTVMHRPPDESQEEDPGPDRGGLGKRERGAGGPLASGGTEAAAGGGFRAGVYPDCGKREQKSVRGLRLIAKKGQLYFVEI